MRRYCTLIDGRLREHRTPVDAFIFLDHALRLHPGHASGCYENERGCMAVRSWPVGGAREMREVPHSGTLPARHFPTAAQILSYVHARHDESESPLWSAGMIPAIIRDVRDHFGTTRGLEHVLLKECFAGDRKTMEQQFYMWDADLETTANHSSSGRHDPRGGALDPVGASGYGDACHAE